MAAMQWDPSTTSLKYGAGGMHRTSAPPRECDASLLKGVPAFTGSEPPPTHTFKSDITKSSYTATLTHATTGLGPATAYIKTPVYRRTSPIKSPPTSLNKRSPTSSRKAPHHLPSTTSTTAGSGNGRPTFQLDVSVAVRRVKGHAAPIGNPEAFSGDAKELASSLQGTNGAYKPLPFNIGPPPQSAMPPLKTKSKAKKSKAPDVNCPGMHGLEQHITPTPGYSCDLCKKNTLPAQCVMHACRECNFDVCDDCVKGVGSGGAGANANVAESELPMPGGDAPGNNDFEDSSEEEQEEGEEALAELTEKERKKKQKQQKKKEKKKEMIKRLSQFMVEEGDASRPSTASAAADLQEGDEAGDGGGGDTGKASPPLLD